MQRLLCKCHNHGLDIWSQCATLNLDRITQIALHIYLVAPCMQLTSFALKSAVLKFDTKVGYSMKKSRI